ncbi:hypothetical protein JCM3774_002891 [Rhodotorula dairenensis]
MSYTAHLDVPYAGATSPRQALDLFLPSSPSPSPATRPLLVYIHGGAWRSESKADFRERLVPLLVEHTELPLAVLDYRLAPADPHPAHITDVLAALDLLTRADLLPGEGAASPQWDRSRLILLGHSAGAFMCLQVLFDPPAESRSPRVPERVQGSIERAFLVDGIYDLPSLLAEYPTYVSFVSDAFGPPPTPSAPGTTERAVDSASTTTTTYALESPARWRCVPSVLRHTTLHILHSQQDELLSLAQPEFLIDRLWSGVGAPVRAPVEEEGEGEEGQHALLEQRLSVDYVALQGGHYEVVHVHADRLARYVAQALRSRDGPTTTSASGDGDL